MKFIKEEDISKRSHSDKSMEDQ